MPEMLSSPEKLYSGHYDASNVASVRNSPPPPPTPEMMMLAKFSSSCIPLGNDDTRNVVLISPSIQETMMTAGLYLGKDYDSKVIEIEKKN